MTNTTTITPTDQQQPVSVVAEVGLEGPDEPGHGNTLVFTIDTDQLLDRIRSDQVWEFYDTTDAMGAAIVVTFHRAEDREPRLMSKVARHYFDAIDALTHTIGLVDTLKGGDGHDLADQLVGVRVDVIELAKGEAPEAFAHVQPG